MEFTDRKFIFLMKWSKSIDGFFKVEQLDSKRKK